MRSKGITTENTDVQRLLRERYIRRRSENRHPAPAMIIASELPWLSGRIPPEVEVGDGKRKITDILDDGAWAGRRCFILAGGPSLKGFDFSQLAGELTIGINRVFEYFCPTINVAMDIDYYKWIHDGTYGPEALEKFKAYQGVKLWIDTRRAAVHGVFVVRGSRGITTQSLHTGIYSGLHTGTGAISLAVALGANPIYLLGYDMGYGGGNGRRRSHFHDGHPKRRSTDRTFEIFRKNTDAYAEYLTGWGAQVINATPGSALKNFTAGKLPDDLESPQKVPVVVSYYTPKYEGAAARLRDSLWRHSIPMDLQAIPDRGTWELNCGYKPEFLLAMLEKHKRPIVWLDADAVVHGRVGLSPPMGSSGISVRVRRRRGHEKGEILSGTIVIANSREARRTLTAWKREMEQKPRDWDQKVLQHVLVRQGVDITAGGLPDEMCAIFDEPGIEKMTPVITHYQKSREWRRVR